MPANTITVYRGSAESKTVTLRDAAGRAVTSYAGTEPVSAEVWSGDERAVLLGPALAWDDAPAGTLRITFNAVETASLDPGIYPIRATIDGKIGRIGSLEVLASPGDAIAPLTYGTYDGILRRCGEWLAKLGSGDSAQSKFAEELHEAVDWTHRNVAARAEAYLSRHAGGYLGDPEAVDLLAAVGDATGTDAALMASRLAIIRDALDTGTSLTLSPIIIEANEYYAASLVVGRVMPSKDGADFKAMAMEWRGRANSLLAQSAFAVTIDDAGPFSLPPV